MPLEPGLGNIRSRAQMRPRLWVCTLDIRVSDPADNRPSLCCLRGYQAPRSPFPRSQPGFDLFAPVCHDDIITDPRLGESTPFRSAKARHCTWQQVADYAVTRELVSAT